MRSSRVLLSRLTAFILATAAPAASAQQIGQSIAQQRYGQRVPPHLPTTTPVFPPGGPRPPPPPPPAPGTTQTVVAPQNSPDRSGGPDHAVVVKDGKFKLDFDKVEIADLVQNISDITGKLFILPDTIHGKISLIGPKHGGEWLTADEVYAAFISALDANSIVIYQVGKYYKLIDRRDASKRGIPTYLGDKEVYPNDEAFITRLFRLKHIDPDTVNGLLQDLLGNEGKARPIQPDLILVSEQAMNMHRIERIIDQIDVAGGGDEVRVIQINYASATELVDKITNIFTDKNKKPGGSSRGITVPVNRPGGGPILPGGPQGEGGDESGINLTKAIADERTNKLIVIASPRSFDRIEAVLKQLDVPVLGESQIHVYYLSNAVADQVSTVLTTLVQGGSTARKAAAGAGGNANANPAANQSVFESTVKISPDKATNSLVIVATGADYTNLIRVIKQLDVPRRQVFVEAVIMEVNLDNELDIGGASHGVVTPNIPGIGTVPIPLGAEPFPIGKGLNSLGGVQSLASLGGFLTGLQGPNNAALAQVLNVSFFPSFAVLLQALQTSSDSNVLSTPHILASDNEDAEITVGQNVPFQSGFSFGGLGSFLGSSSSALGTAGSALGGLGGLGSSLPIGQIQRQNVELKLKIKPQINEGDYIRMTIDESTEEIASTDPVLGPTTSKRAAKTVIVAKDQESVVIGGLMQDRVIKSNNKTPLLGDIPVIGWLFRYDTTKKEKVNLLLFLTPYIIRSQADFRNIFERKMEERREFVEEFYGESSVYRVPVDYTRKTGPLGRMTVDIRAEQNKVENGGNGQGTGERTFRPTTGTLLQGGPEENGAGEPQPAPGSVPASEREAPPPPGEAPPPPLNAPVPIPAPAPPPPPAGGEAPAP